MALMLKQSTAVDVLIGPFLDETNATDSEEGESPVVLLSKNGQALGAKNDATTPVHDDGGYYNCELDATDTGTVGTLVLVVEDSANALPVRHEFQVVEEATYAFLYAAGATPLADVNAEADTALADYDAPTKAEMDTGHGLLATEAKQDIIDTVADAIKAVTDLLPNAGALSDLAAILTDTGTTLDGKVNIIDTVVDAIKAVTDLLPDAGALSDLAAILVDTGTTLQAELDGIQADTENIQARIPDNLFGGRIEARVGAMVTSVAQQITEETFRMTTATIEGLPNGTPDDRTLYGVIAALMHKHERDAGDNNIVLYESDDSTVLVTIPITKGSALDPIKSLDPP